MELSSRWLGLAAIAVNVQEEIDEFKNVRLLKRIKLACLNRLKVIITIAVVTLGQLIMTFNTCFLLAKGKLTIKNFGKIMSIGTLSNLATITVGICALPFHRARASKTIFRSTILVMF